MRLQRDNGIDLFTDGELRGDMLALYKEIPGIQERRGVPRVVHRIRPMEDPAQFTKVRDLDALRTRYPEAQFKVCLTGPTTFLLASAAGGAGPAYRGPMDANLHDDLTEALRPIAHEIARRGAYLQLDEPILSQGMRDYGPALNRLDRLASEAPRVRASVHVCGSLARAKTLEALFRLRSVSVLSLAFAGRLERENRSLLEPASWQDSDLSLGAGSIDVQVSRPEELMSAEDVEALLGEIVGGVGREHVAFVHPDCGLRGTPPALIPGLLDSLHRGFQLAFSPGT
jgi:methionine synthase II (cobalamin-independent)